MKTSDFKYKLPKELIAQYPLEKRDGSRLLVLHRDSGEIEHRVFSEITDYFSSGDTVVANNTKVLPARIFGNKTSGGRVEILLHKKLDECLWEAIVRPGRRLHSGYKIIFDGDLYGVIVERLDNGKRIIKFSSPAEEWLEKTGRMPLPPYIERDATEKDSKTYQTIYAKNPGAVAAPTAGLHLTEKLIKKIESKGIPFCYLTLHVGLGTFRPVQTENIEDHMVESEWAEIKEDVCGVINNTIKNRKKVWAVGTTSVRTLESFSSIDGVQAKSESVNLFIYPPYRFKTVNGIITNFHLPGSSLLALVCAFGGYENVMNAYRVAVREKYRFYSYGDAMLIV